MFTQLLALGLAVSFVNPLTGTVPQVRPASAHIEYHACDALSIYDGVRLYVDGHLDERLVYDAPIYTWCAISNGEVINESPHISDLADTPAEHIWMCEILDATTFAEGYISDESVFFCTDGHGGYYEYEADRLEAKLLVYDWADGHSTYERVLSVE